MRLDKFLQRSRLVRRRTLADRLCTHHRVRLNGRVAKASSPVRVGDLIEVDFGGGRLVARVLAVPQAPTLGEPLVEVLERGPSPV